MKMTGGRFVAPAEYVHGIDRHNNEQKVQVRLKNAWLVGRRQTDLLVKQAGPRVDRACLLGIVVRSLFVYWMRTNRMSCVLGNVTKDTREFNLELVNEHLICL